jgi:L-iditol 2-dehydrogenase
MKNKIANLVSVGNIEISEEEVLYSNSSKKVLVKMAAVGICGSDIHYFDHGGLGSFKQPLPMPMGHEPSGTVYDCSPYSKFKPGDRVAIEPGFSCYECSPCFSGKHNLCDAVKFMGANSDGALREFIVLEEDQLFKIPNMMSDNAAALLEPAGIALHTFNILNLKFGSKVAIVGAGPIGLSVAIYCRKMGILPLLVDTLEYRNKFAQSLGFTAASPNMMVNSAETFAAVIDAAGDSDSFNLCTKLCSKSGTVAIIGIPDSDFISVNPHTMRIKELKIQNIRRANQTLYDCINHFEKDSYILDKMVTHTFSFEHVQKAFELVSGKKDKVVKCMINF